MATTSYRVPGNLIRVHYLFQALAFAGEAAFTPIGPKPAPAPRRDYRACCDRAVIVPCVCSIKFRCDVHGENCHGSHD